MLPRPVVIVNVKTYPEATGRALDDLLAKLAGAADGRVAFAVQATDIPRAVAALDAAGGAAADVPVLGQHVDPEPLGSHTGAVTPEALRDAGAVGSLLNHAERQVPSAHVLAAVARLAELGMASVVCADDLDAARELAGTGPDLVAIEPPELIGGDVSVTSADPAIVQGAVEAVRAVDPDVGVLCGAGVKSGADVAKAIELGTDGVLLASGVVKAADPAKALEDLLGGLDAA